MHPLVGMGEMRRMGEMREMGEMRRMGEMREKIYLNLPHLPHLPHLSHLHSWQKDQLLMHHTPIFPTFLTFPIFTLGNGSF